MGVGTPDDIVEAVARGIDMFDCVMPTRAGRHGLAYTSRGRVNLRNARHADDPRPLDEESDCPAARDYSRAYLHHLTRTGETLGAMLLTWNNLHYYQSLMAGLREAVEAGGFEAFGRNAATVGQRATSRRSPDRATALQGDFTAGFGIHFHAWARLSGLAGLDTWRYPAFRVPVATVLRSMRT